MAKAKVSPKWKGAAVDRIRGAYGGDKAPSPGTAMRDLQSYAQGGRRSRYRQASGFARGLVGDGAKTGGKGAARRMGGRARVAAYLTALGVKTKAATGVSDG